MPLLSTQIVVLPLPDHRALLLPPACLPSSSCSPRLRWRRRLGRSSTRTGLLRVVSPETSNAVATDAAAITGAQSDDDNNNTATAWSAFAARVSGEWDGYSAEFTSAGDPVPLPENVVPEAFREWGVPVLDWQTQCPTLADPAAPPCALQYRLVRLLPTVGCEAAAAAVHTSHQRHASSAAAFAYASGGSYVAAWPRGPAPVLEVEHCVVRPGPGGGGEEEVSRVRVVQTVALGKEARLRGVKVFSEQWYGPFRNGEQLGGCAVRETAFAGGEKLDVSEVLGRWESRDAAVARFSDQMDPETGKFAELAPTEPPTTTVWRDADGVVTLPKQLWSAFKEHGDGEFLCEVGWALGGGSAVTSRCLVTKDGDVKEIAAAYESRVSAGT